MTETKIDGNNFFKRLEKVYKLWENNVNFKITLKYRIQLFRSVTAFLYFGASSLKIVPKSRPHYSSKFIFYHLVNTSSGMSLQIPLFYLLRPELSFL